MEGKAGLYCEEFLTENNLEHLETLIEIENGEGLQNIGQ